VLSASLPQDSGHVLLFLKYYLSINLVSLLLMLSLFLALSPSFPPSLDSPLSVPSSIYVGSVDGNLHVDVDSTSRLLLDHDSPICWSVDIAYAQICGETLLENSGRDRLRTKSNSVSGDIRSALGIRKTACGESTSIALWHRHTIFMCAHTLINVSAALSHFGADTQSSCAPTHSYTLVLRRINALHHDKSNITWRKKMQTWLSDQRCPSCSYKMLTKSSSNPAVLKRSKKK